MNPDLPAPVILRPRRLKLLLLTAMSLVFVAAGILQLGDGRLMSWLSVLFFGLCGLVFIIQLHPRASFLKLDRDSFTFCALFRAHTVRWEDTREFGVTQIVLNRMVGWNFAPGYRPAGKARALSHSVSGFESALPDTYGLKAEDLAQIMEHWRANSQNSPVQPDAASS